MKFLTWFSQMREPAWYILTRCVLLACAMLCSALVVLVWAGESSMATHLLQNYASHTLTMALVVLGAGILGSALMQDMLEHLG